ncbi:MAG: glycerophosphodiester phosphodiesterase [bacterium]
MVFPLRGPLRIAHRGMPNMARENTLASFALALDAGADGIELDVHATADGVVVVHHDPMLAGGATISELSHHSIRGESYEGAQMPTLRNVCDLVNGHAELFVEIKGEGIERLVSDELDRYDGRCAIHSFDHALIQRLYRGKSRYRLGLLYETAPLNVLAELASRGALDLWPHRGIVTRELVDEVHSMQGRVIPWTVNAAIDVQRLVACGVDGICTDDVRLLSLA